MTITEAELKDIVRKKADERGLELTDQHEEALDRMAPDVVEKLEQNHDDFVDWFDSNKSSWLD